MTTRWRPHGSNLASFALRRKEMSLPTDPRSAWAQPLATSLSRTYLLSNKTLHASPRKHTLEGSQFPSPGNDLRERFGALLTQADAGMLRSMGVPENWREQGLWKVRASEDAVVAVGRR